MVHKFLVVDSLVTPVILGTDFLHCQENNVTLDFSTSPVTVFSSKVLIPDPQQRSPKNSKQDLLKPIWEEERKMRNKVCATLTTKVPESGVIDECSIPRFSDPDMYDVPNVNRVAYHKLSVNSQICLEQNSN